MSNNRAAVMNIETWLESTWTWNPFTRGGSHTSVLCRNKFSGPELISGGLEVSGNQHLWWDTGDQCPQHGWPAYVCIRILKQCAVKMSGLILQVRSLVYLKSSIPSSSDVYRTGMDSSANPQQLVSQIITKWKEGKSVFKASNYKSSLCTFVR